ncbi:hypothetical protein [Microbispora sp. H10885]|uniref:hypothetical protein n=1 Tax=Microbispora sp. H10885 TaxID=2729110 RepID=UPI001602E56B|nr:hypothetical protein [Microbispora sp. H10885]
MRAASAGSRAEVGVCGSALTISSPRSSLDGTRADAAAPTRSLGLVDAVGLGRALGRLPGELVVVGIER